MRLKCEMNDARCVMLYIDMLYIYEPSLYITMRALTLTFIHTVDLLCYIDDVIYHLSL